MLLMRELEAPWTHFFGSNLDPLVGTYKYGIDGGLLTTQYQEAKGSERYGNSPADGANGFGGFTLETLVEKPQALFFDSVQIMDERFTRVVDEWPGEPTRSPTWDAAYQAFKRGEQLALPYFDAVVTDPRKLAALTSAYRSFAAGTTPAAELPDLSDIFPDDPQTRAEVGLETEPDATPAEALVQACGACHNDALDQSLSRARFNVGLSRMNRAELDVAVDRLGRSPQDPGAMPPKDTRQLTPAARARLVDYLQNGSFPEEDLAFLDHAATRGMTGGEQPPRGSRPPSKASAGDYEGGRAP
jgi:mono/diheme cytochrome c family protein